MLTLTGGAGNFFLIWGYWGRHCFQGPVVHRCWKRGPMAWQNVVLEPLWWGSVCALVLALSLGTCAQHCQHTQHKVQGRHSPLHRPLSVKCPSCHFKVLSAVIPRSLVYFSTQIPLMLVHPQVCCSEQECDPSALSMSSFCPFELN